jgi:hypothetical protein
MRKFWKLEPSKQSTSPFRAPSTDGEGPAAAISDDQPHRSETWNPLEWGHAQNALLLNTTSDSSRSGHGHGGHSMHAVASHLDRDGGDRAIRIEFGVHNPAHDLPQPSLTAVFAPLDPLVGPVVGHESDLTNTDEAPNAPAHEHTGSDAALSALSLSVVLIPSVPASAVDAYPITDGESLPAVATNPIINGGSVPAVDAYPITDGESLPAVATNPIINGGSVPAVDAYPITDGESLPAVATNPIINGGSVPAVDAYPITDGETLPEIHWDGLIHAIISLPPLPIDMSAPTPISDGDSLPAFPIVDYGSYTVPELIALGHLSEPVPGSNPDMIW